MAEKHDFEDEEFEEFDDELPEDFDVEADGENDAGPDRVTSAERAEKAWQRLDRRGESRWLAEQLADWDDWDESLDAH
ncbi:MAG: hypothetical protein AAFX10_12185 [Pseudomonadota bacterium]